MSVEIVLVELEGVIVDLSAPREIERASRDAALATATDETDVELASLRAQRAFEDALERVLLLHPGARQALVSLSVRVRIGIVTRLPRHVAQRILARAELDPVTSCLVARDDVVHPLPAPDAHLRALERLARIRPFTTDRVVAVVADSDGIAAARAAHLNTLAVGPALTPAPGGAWVASIAGVTYDALVQQLERSGVRPT
jgi:beta-phosphoglucomutase-like phosphatase (HAD superfamily)